jgi:hypothetical protein
MAIASCYIYGTVSSNGYRILAYITKKGVRLENKQIFVSTDCNLETRRSFSPTSYWPVGLPLCYHDVGFLNFFIKVFEGVDWEDLLFSAGRTDSTPEYGRDFRTDHNARVMEIRASGRTESESASLQCLGKDVNQSRLRNQWQLLTAMEPAMFGWTFQTEERALKRDELRHTGPVNFNQTSAYQDIWPQTFLSDILLPWDVQGSDALYKSTFGELPGSQKLGRLITNLVSTDMFPAERSATSLYCPSLSNGA